MAFNYVKLTGTIHQYADERQEYNRLNRLKINSKLCKLVKRLSLVRKRLISTDIYRYLHFIISRKSRNENFVCLQDDSRFTFYFELITHYKVVM